MSESPVAIVTGASRGIGRAGALALAEAGFDVVVSARTVREGEGVAEPNSVREDVTLAVPGSLERTAQEVAERGQRALIVPMDLSDRASVEALVPAVLEQWGRVDVLYNNAIFRGVGTLDRITDLTMESMTALMAGNFMHQILLIQQVLPHMGQHLLDEQDLVHEVAGHERRHGLHREIGDAIQRAHTPEDGVVVEHVDTTPLLEHGGHERLHRRPVAEIHGDDESPLAALGDLLGGALEAAGHREGDILTHRVRLGHALTLTHGPGAHDHIETGLGESERSGPSDPATGAGHDRHW